jgi:hypothetical protein
MTLEANRVLVLTGASTRVARCTDCQADLMLLVTERERRLAWCMACRQTLTMIEGGAKPKALRVATHLIKQWVDGGETQLIKTAEGATIIILVSLPRMSERETGRLRPRRSPRRLSLDAI